MQDNAKETDRQSALAIKCYLKFCKMIGEDHWDPDASEIVENVEIKMEPLDEYEIETIDTRDYQEEDEQVDDIFTDAEEEEEESFELDEEMAEPKPKKKKKETSYESTLRRKEEEKQTIAACQICNPGTSDYAAGVKQATYDKLMSNHLWKVHKVKNNVMLFNEHQDQLVSKMISRKGSYTKGEGLAMHCGYKNCSYQITCKKRMARHVDYHEKLKQVKKSYFCTVNGETVVSYPCPDCHITPFESYSDLSLHWNQAHPPEFTFEERVVIV